MRKKQNKIRLHAPEGRDTFLQQVSGWREKIAEVSQEMTSEHRQLTDAPIKDFSTAVLYQEFLITAIGFLDRADEMLEEYKQIRMENHISL